MAKCKLCKTNIPDGAQYCKDCQDKEKLKANESYLDSLLNSVKNTPSPTESIYKKNNIKTDIEKKEADKFDFDEFDFYRVDMSDIDEFETFNIADDLEDSQNNIMIDDEDLFGEKLSNLFEKELNINEEDDLKAQIANLVKSAEYDSNDNKMGEKADTNLSNLDSQATNLNEIYNKNQQSPNSNEKIKSDSQSPNSNEKIKNASQSPNSNEKIKNDSQSTNSNEKIKNDSQSPNSNEKIKSDSKSTNPYEKIISDPQSANSKEESPSTNLNEINNDNSATKQGSNVLGSITNNNEFLDFQEDFNIDSDLNDLINSLNSSDDEIALTHFEEEFPEYAVREKDFVNDNVQIPEDNDELEEFQTEDDDFMSLLSQISYDDPVAADVKEISELLSGNKVITEAKANTPSNVGEVFSDALKAVSNLKDDEYDEESILNQIPDKKSKKKNKKAKKGETKSESDTNESDNTKKSLFQRIFGNIKDDKTKKSTVDKNESPKKSEEINNKKSKKVGKGKKGKETEVEDEDNPQKSNKETEASKKDKKAEKAEKKKKTKDVIQVIDEIEDDEGRINRLGAFIVFVFFGLLVVFLITGANVVTYSLSIQHATNYFGQQKYTQAYNEVYGMDIKDEDIEIYDKIKTVMFVNKQLNSYNNYVALEKFPEALDSLLKGLQRYEKYIELATMLGIKTDLDYVRSQILAELDNQFNLSEEEAITMIHYDNMDEYSLKVYDVVLENMNQ